jgi:hypothetical protein
MKKQDIGVLFISFRILRRLCRLGIPAEYCFHIDELENLIRENRQYKIIVICRAQRMPIINNIIKQRGIDEIYTLGDCAEPRITHKTTAINTNEQGLISHIVTETIRYTRSEQIKQKELGNYDLANALARDWRKLVDLLETL